MKIELVFIPSPGIGHVRSTAAIAKLLVDRDDRLSITLIIIPPRFSSDSSSSSINSVYPEFEGRLRYCLLPAEDESTHDPEQNYLSYIESKKPQVRDVVSELFRQISKDSYSPRRLAGFVADMFCTPMLDLADEYSLPVYIYYTSNASYLGLLFHVQFLHDEMKFEVSELRDTEAELDVPTLARRLPAKCLPSVMLSKDWFPNVLRRARSLRGTKGILVNSVAEMEPHALKFLSSGNNPPVYPVGPVLDFNTDRHDSDDKQRSEILQWLDEQPPRSVLFLCFGSMGGFSGEQAREIALALERTGHRFLWSLRLASPEEILAGTPPKDFTNLEEILPEGFLDRTAENGKIIGWAPQRAVLEKPAIGGFVSHCGWNSTLESLWFGVPTAVWPIYAEQQFNAFQMVEELGLAAEIRKDYRGDLLVGEPKMVTVEEIEKGIKCVMEQDSTMRKRVQEMSDKIHVALMDGGSSNAALQKFIYDVVENIS